MANPKFIFEFSRDLSPSNTRELKGTAPHKEARDIHETIIPEASLDSDHSAFQGQLAPHIIEGSHEASNILNPESNFSENGIDEALTSVGPESNFPEKTEQENREASTIIYPGSNSLEKIEEENAEESIVLDPESNCPEKTGNNYTPKHVIIPSDDDLLPNNFSSESNHKVSPKNNTTEDLSNDDTTRIDCKVSDPFKENDHLEKNTTIDLQNVDATKIDHPEEHVSLTTTHTDTPNMDSYTSQTVETPTVDNIENLDESSATHTAQESFTVLLDDNSTTSSHEEAVTTVESPLTESSKPIQEPGPNVSMPISAEMSSECNESVQKHNNDQTKSTTETHMLEDDKIVLDLPECNESVRTHNTENTNNTTDARVLEDEQVVLNLTEETNSNIDTLVVKDDTVVLNLKLDTNNTQALTGHLLDSVENFYQQQVTLVIPPPSPAKSGIDNMGFSADPEKGGPPRKMSSGKVKRRSIRFSIYDILNRPDETNFRKKLGRFIVVLAAFCNLFFSMGIVFSLGTFLPSWLEEFQESRARTNSVQSFLIGITFGSGIIVGFLIDRYGVRLATRCGTLLCAAGLLAAVFCPDLTSLMLIVGLLSGFGSSLTQLGSIVAISLTLKRSAPFAIGIITTGGGIGSAVMPYVIKHFIDVYGWRGAFYLMSGLNLQVLWISYLMTLFMEQATRGKRTTQTISDSLGLKAKFSLICSPRLVIFLMASITAAGAANGFTFVVLDWANLHQGDGVFYLSLMSFTSTAGRLGVGGISMLRFANTSLLMAISCIVAMSMLVVLSFIDTSMYALLIVILVIFGVFNGGMIGIYGGAVLDQVGKEAFSLALGIVSTFNGLASLVYGILYGFLFDVTQSYQLALQTFGSIGVACAALLVLDIARHKFC